MKVLAILNLLGAVQGILLAIALLSIKRGNRAGRHHWLAQAYGKKARTGGMMSRASFAGKARDALLKSLELDPGALDARADLARYYNSVLGIVGGSAERERVSRTSRISSSKMQAIRTLFGQQA